MRDSQSAARRIQSCAVLEGSSGTQRLLSEICAEVGAAALQGGSRIYSPIPAIQQIYRRLDTNSLRAVACQEET